EERLVTACAALLHDVGHGPFSHALEKLSGVRHEERTVQILCHPESGVHQALASFSSDFPERVATRIRGDGDGPAYLKEVVSSQLDADRLDYILRDGHMTGVRIGNYDLARVLAMLDVVDGHLAVHQGGQAAVEGYLLARFHMYQQVYLHKTSRSAERMLSAALSRAVQLRRDGDGDLWWPDDSLGAVLLGDGEDPLGFATIDDVDVWRCLKRWADASDRALADLSRGLLDRRLYKTLQLPMGEEGVRAFARAQEVAEGMGFQPDYHVLLDASGDSPYHPYTGVGREARSIRMVLRSGAPCYIEDRSAVVGMLGQLEHQQRLICFHPDLSAVVSEALGDLS
ncbi:MAG: HD domain-containing protein, partial [Myxococcota bacterium]|nr:HD domain-containing protein [Myxococcota bacterium]